MIRGRGARMLSAATMALVAGCAGGARTSTAPPQPATGAQTNAYIEIDIPPRTTSARKRRITYVSPSTASASIAVYSGPGVLYQTTFAFAPPTCTPISGGGGYLCGVNLPVGANTLYANLYDQAGNLLSTNQYSGGTPINIAANGSAQSNTVSVTMQGVVYAAVVLAPHNCVFARPQAVPLYFFDADTNPIVGPLANPITVYATAYNGAGLGAIDFYGTYNGVARSIDNVPITDTSIYSSLYLSVSGQEGAVTLYGSYANIPTRFGGGAGGGTGNSTVFSAVSYQAFGINGGAIYGYGIQATTNQVFSCGEQFIVDKGLYNPTLMGSQRDGSGYGSLLSIADSPNVHVIPFTPTASDSFQVYVGGTPPHVYFHVGSTYSVPASSTIYNMLESTNFPGRISIVAQNSTTNTAHVDLIDFKNGQPFNPGLYSFNLQTPVVSTPCCVTWLATPDNLSSLYYTLPGTAVLYGLNLTSGSPLGTLTFPGSALAGGQIYAIQTSGIGYTNVFVRGTSSTGSYYMCVFDAAQAPALYCHGTSSTNNSDASIRYDSLSGQLLFSSGGPQMYALPAHVSPAAFAASLFPQAAYTLSHNAFRFIPTVGAPGVVGLYGSTGQITLLRFNASSGAWGYLATFSWPNSHMAVLAP